MPWTMTAGCRARGAARDPTGNRSPGPETLLPAMSRASVAGCVLASDSCVTAFLPKADAPGGQAKLRAHFGELAQVSHARVRQLDNFGRVARLLNFNQQRRQIRDNLRLARAGL